MSGQDACPKTGHQDKQLPGHCRHMSLDRACEKLQLPQGARCVRMRFMSLVTGTDCSRSCSDVGLSEKVIGDEHLAS